MTLRWAGIYREDQPGAGRVGVSDLLPWLEASVKARSKANSNVPALP